MARWDITLFDFTLFHVVFSPFCHEKATNFEKVAWLIDQFVKAKPEKDEAKF